MIAGSERMPSVCDGHVSLTGKSCYSELKGDLADQNLHDAFRVASTGNPLRDGRFAFGNVLAKQLERGRPLFTVKGKGGANLPLN